MKKIHPSEITPEHVYLSRRDFMKGAGAMALSSLVVAACGSGETPSPSTSPDATAVPTIGGSPQATPQPTSLVDEYGDPLNSYEDITSFNNFYEFTTNKTAVAELAKDFTTSPWMVEVGGLVNQPATLDLDDIQKRFPQEDRIYRLRCVEGWSMVIPWVGFPLASLLEEVEPLSDAKYVRFETLYDPDQMAGQRNSPYPWPYVEGLRLDEAMNGLTILATGIYGKGLPPQSGAPVRLVVPWKYGFKSIKSIVKIDLVAEEPTSTWMEISPNEYGFYANVNPDVDHPRWSQATEQRVRESGRRPTLLFNGYEEEVGNLYEGLDLRENY
ncbi:MAG: protein-methionine-sulfoxide reductase catalytic subunit MsrP [Anaerolineaceae bacterium]|nr:MAG: protein-methionine-sulfoxide reductase catalytic subunit MsrP [Anaerolineaceae bacterium]